VRKVAFCSTAFRRERRDQFGLSTLGGKANSTKLPGIAKKGVTRLGVARRRKALGQVDPGKEGRRDRLQARRKI